ncbi:MAG TPA: RNA 2',3'-cyclic phosphodiesterase [Terriglobales bacterium]|nr:RNA 2',3'-cyclic phosphodiesterase [Terriglobales bacterium]
MRLFVALDIDGEIRDRIAGFVSQVQELAPAVRWVSPESLHITLKFIGEQSDAMLEQIEASLASIQCGPFRLGLGGAGFFPTARAARVFWIGIKAEEGLATLAETVEKSLAQIGIAKENREFSPHLTLARTRAGSGAPAWRKGDRPNRQFSELQKFLEASPAPEFGTMAAREFFLYRSQLSPKGAQYTKMARFELKSRSTI